MLKKLISGITPIITSWYAFFIIKCQFFNVDISAGHFYYLQEVRKKVHYFVNTSITATCMSVEGSHDLQLCQWLAACRWFSPGTPISSTDKTDRSEKTEILLKMAIHQTKNNRKLSPTLGCVMGPIFTSLSNDIFHVFSPMVSCSLQCSVCSSLFPCIVFLGLVVSVFSDYFLLQLSRFS
jgi:hypothetical protein